MADYEIRYKMQSAPQPTQDGSEQVAIDTYAVRRIAGTTGPFTDIPGRHQTVLLPADGIQTALATGNNQAKVGAIKNLMRDNLFTPSAPAPNNWDQASLEAYLDANDVALAQATALNTFITVTLNQTYPVTFAL